MASSELQKLSNARSDRSSIRPVHQLSIPGENQVCGRANPEIMEIEAFIKKAVQVAAVKLDDIGTQVDEIKVAQNDIGQTLTNVIWEANKKIVPAIASHSQQIQTLVNKYGSQAEDLLWLGKIVQKAHEAFLSCDTDVVNLQEEMKTFAQYNEELTVKLSDQNSNLTGQINGHDLKLISLTGSFDALDEEVQTFSTRNKNLDSRVKNLERQSISTERFESYVSANDLKFERVSAEKKKKKKKRSTLYHRRDGEKNIGKIPQKDSRT